MSLKSLNNNQNITAPLNSFMHDLRLNNLDPIDPSVVTPHSRVRYTEQCSEIQVPFFSNYYIHTTFFHTIRFLVLLCIVPFNCANRNQLSRVSLRYFITRFSTQCILEREFKGLSYNTRVVAFQVSPIWGSQPPLW